MVNYGYECKGWSNSEMNRLAQYLRALLNNGKFADQYKMTPYVESEGELQDFALYKGVRIRRITHLTDEQQTELVTEADKIYLDMKKENGK